MCADWLEGGQAAPSKQGRRRALLGHRHQPDRCRGLLCTRVPHSIFWKLQGAQLKQLPSREQDDAKHGHQLTPAATCLKPCIPMPEHCSGGAGVGTLWRLVLDAPEAVSAEARALLVALHTQLGGSIGDHGAAIRAAFLRCASQTSLHPRASELAKPHRTPDIVDHGAPVQAAFIRCCRQISLQKVGVSRRH